MKTIFSTADLRPHERFDAWHEIATRNIVAYEAVPKNRATFEAELQFGQLDFVRILKWKAAPQVVHRNTAHIAKATNDDLMLVRVNRGRMTFEQDEQQIIPAAGDLVLCDSLLPRTMDLDELCAAQIATIPRRALAERIGWNGEPMPERLIAANDHEAGMLSAWLATLPRFVTGIEPAQAAREAHHLADMLAASLAPLIIGPLRISSAGRVMLHRMDQFIDERHRDPELTRDDIAVFVGISVRHLNRLLHDADRPNITETLLMRRLVSAQRMLGDPRNFARRRTVLEIAMLCGFNDPTHFGRAFKNAYGMLPRDFRARAISRLSTDPENAAAMRQRVPSSR